MFIHKHTFVLLCAKHWNIALIHQSPNKPWFNWNNPEIAFHFCDPWVDILPPRNAEMPICKIRWVARRGMLEGPNLPIRKTSMTGALASRWIYWILRAGKSFPKNVIKTAILEFQFCKSTLPKLTVSLRYPYFWKQHFPDSYSFIAGDIEISRFGMSSISGIHWAFVAEVFSKFLMWDVRESPASLIHSCHLFDGSFNHF